MLSFRKFNCLVDQTTRHVVWISVDSCNNPPIFDSSLTWIYYENFTDIKLWNEFCRYALYINSSNNPIVRDPTESDIEKIKIRRAKAFVIANLNLEIERRYTRMGYTFAPNHLRGQDTIDSKWVALYQQEINCSKEDAMKLIAFTVDEYDKAVYLLESIRLRCMVRIQSATTLEEVDEINHMIATSLILRYVPLTNQPFI